MIYVASRVYSEDLERALQERSRIQSELAADACRRVVGEELDVPRRNGPADSTEGRLLRGRLYALRVRNGGAGSPSVGVPDGARDGRLRPLSDESGMEAAAGIILGLILSGICWLVIIGAALWFWSATQ